MQQLRTVPDIRSDLARDGIVVLRGVLSEEETGRVLAAGQAAATLPHEQRWQLFYEGPLPSEADGLYAIPTLLGLVNQILGEDVALYYQRYVLKDAFFSGPAILHQDIAYYHGTQNKYHVFLPLTRVDEANGGMRFWLRSHRFGLLGHGPIQLERFSDVELTPVIALEPGDVVIMHNALWHESPPASTPEPRYIYQAIYQPSSDGSYYDTPHLVSGRWLTQERVSKNDANMLSTIGGLLKDRQDLQNQVYALQGQLNELHAKYLDA